MEVLSIKPNHLIQCGRVYLFVSQENTHFSVINCLFCNKDYSEWPKFYNHLEHVHQLESIKLKLLNKSNERIVEKDSVEKPQPEISYAKSAYLDKNSCSREGNIIRQQQKTDLGCTNNDNFKNVPIIPDSDRINHERKSSKTISSCFFRLYSTDPEIMLKFIELLRHHPCQWNHKHNFSFKEKRSDSTLNLTKKLKEILNINITPQGTRASILSLLRWFDREYIRYLKCQQNDFKFISMHREYFDKLLEFLPHKHLKPMTCNECLKLFKSEHLLIAHRHKYHNGQVPFHCRYCGHGFIHQSSYKMHENRHIKIHVWPCKICRYQATSKSDYTKHLATHSSQQPHKCTICGLSYKTKTNLNVHLKTHSVPNYECELCKKKFYEKYRYKRHIWQHEEQEMSGKSIDNFTCEICGRRFTSNKNLMKHQVVHIQENYKIEDEESNAYKLTNAIAYFCDYCLLQFNYKEAYETHMNLKHDVKII